MAAILAPSVAAAADKTPFTLVIDPGHGGKDAGCEGELINEKTIVLDVAQRLGRIISSTHPEVRQIYTRNDDRFVELNQRAAIANRAKADLFISIHVNSIDRRTKGRQAVHGASVYTLGVDRNEGNLAVAMRENSVIELENDFSETYQGFDPNSTESYIIFELTQNIHQRNSIKLAQNILGELISTASRADKGVRQAGFLVLRATSMPSVLVELDFICNPEAERFLASEEGREQCARAIANAFTAYYNPAGWDAPTPVATAPAPQEQPQAAAAPVYTVQFLTSSAQLPDSDPRLAKLEDVSYYVHDNLYKYTAGKFPTLAKAKKYLREVKKNYPEAFIIKLLNGKRAQ